jgi:hypothetical protein
MKLSVLAAAGAMFLVSVAGAATIPNTLDQLVSAGSAGITVGDKTFYDFTVTGGVGAGQINVVQAPGTDVGIEFQFNWSSTAGNNLDTLIRYKVHVNDTTPTQRLITGVGLHFDGNTDSGNTNVGTNATVTESVSDLSGNILGQLSTFNAGSNFSSVNRNDASFVVTSPTRDLMLAKDIMVHSTANGGTATISLVDNTFQQSPPTVPSSVPLPPAALMAISSIALGAFTPLRRRILGRA